MEKTFDCLKMKDEIQAKVYEKTKDMTFSELRAYLDKNLENDTFWQRLMNRNPTQSSRS
ncbi:MAG: hypothetical protein FWD56_07965 [Bacteroidales bacterium]|nr:hypothetical protein [Bacteroidales bacterium]